MAMIDHWHPVLCSRSLSTGPVRVRVAGHDLAVYRTSKGVAALGDECPHRRMRLSLGEVVGDKLQCRYHGWTFTPDGQGESPGTPKLHACATSYDAREEHGAIWVKPPRQPRVPPIRFERYCPFASLSTRRKPRSNW